MLQDLTRFDVYVTILPGTKTNIFTHAIIKCIMPTVIGKIHCSKRSSNTEISQRGEWVSEQYSIDITK